MIIRRGPPRVIVLTALIITGIAAGPRLICLNCAAADIFRGATGEREREAGEKKMGGGGAKGGKKGRGCCSGYPATTMHPRGGGCPTGSPPPPPGWAPRPEQIICRGPASLLCSEGQQHNTRPWAKTHPCTPPHPPIPLSAPLHACAWARAHVCLCVSVCVYVCVCVCA